MAGTLRARVADPAGGEREAVLLRVADEDGRVGWGEASPLPGYSPDSLADVEGALDDWALRWADGEITADSNLGALAADDPFGGLEPDSLPSAACAIDTAILDLAARRKGVPLHSLLLDRAGPERPINRLAAAGLVTLDGAERPGAPRSGTSATARVTALVAEGYRTVKCKLGGAGTGGSRTSPDAAFAAEMSELRAIRDEHPYLTLRLDVNGRWSPDSARERLRALKREIDPEFVEQPVGPEELLSFAAPSVALAADESLRIPGAADRLTGPGGCAVFVLKPMLLGGPRRCIVLARTAFADGIRVVVSHAFGGPIAHAAACELALALAAADPSGDAPAAGLAGHDDLPQRSGAWIVPVDGTGHGTDVSW
ncbi:MAG: mandelate racemase/muconate lactonizing enzyme family protein [Gemmatimonadota bacterium]